MAKKITKNLPKLGFIDIVTRADTDVIKQAYEARIQIDELLKQREKAYLKISRLENEIESLVGEPNLFEFPPPPHPVAPVKIRSQPPSPTSQRKALGSKEDLDQPRTAPAKPNTKASENTIESVTQGTDSENGNLENNGKNMKVAGSKPDHEEFDESNGDEDNQSKLNKNSEPKDIADN